MAAPMNQPEDTAVPATHPPRGTRVEVAIRGIRLREVPVSRTAGAGPSDDGHLLMAKTVLTALGATAMANTFGSTAGLRMLTGSLNV